jgi:hypothetical protein
LFVGRVSAYFGFTAFPKQLKGSQPGLFDQFTEIFLGEWLVEIIDLLVIDAVFTKQRGQIAARCSGRLFVNRDLLRHRYILSPDTDFFINIGQRCGRYSTGILGAFL